MSLERFISTLWEDNEEKMRDMKKLRELLESLKRQENEIYIVSIQSNQ